jgi:ABC-type transport system involved in cytochrome bd biosynthesis fused ATPase/permease subunit
VAAAIAGFLGTILGAVISVVSLEVRSRRERRASRRNELRERFLDWISTQRHIAANLIETTPDKLQIEAEIVLAAARLLGASDTTSSEMSAFQRSFAERLKTAADGEPSVTPSSVSQELASVLSLMRADISNMK